MSSNRRSDGDAPAHFEPTQAWHDAFRKQYDTTLLLLAKVYAARRLSGAPGSPRADEEHARQLVLDALGDTLLGVVRWDPDTKSLAQHVQDVIKRRTALDKRASRFRHESMDATSAHGESPALVEAERVLRERAPDPEAAEEAARRVAVLRCHAARDAQVLAVIDAIIAGCETSAEVQQRTGLSELEYRRVRRRYSRLIKRVAAQLGDDPTTGAWS